MRRPHAISGLCPSLSRGKLNVTCNISHERKDILPLTRGIDAPRCSMQLPTINVHLAHSLTDISPRELLADSHRPLHTRGFVEHRDTRAASLIRGRSYQSTMGTAPIGTRNRFRSTWSRSRDNEEQSRETRKQWARARGPTRLESLDGRSAFVVKQNRWGACGQSFLRWTT